MKSSGSPFKYLILLLFKFGNLQSCRNEEIRKVWPVLAIGTPNSQNHAKPTFFELFLTQNPSDSETRFLKGVAIDGTRKTRAIYDLSFSEVLKRENSELKNEWNFLSEIKWITI